MARAWAACLVLESDARAVTSAREEKGNVMDSNLVKIVARSVRPAKAASAARGVEFSRLRSIVRLDGGVLPWRPGVEGIGSVPFVFAEPAVHSCGVRTSPVCYMKSYTIWPEM